MTARVGLVDGEAVRVLRERIEKLKASITNLEKRMSSP
jgi:prefoldin subunit 5